MAQKVSILLIFDLKAILAGRTRDWTIFDEIGTCFVPQIVIKEIEFLCKQSITPEEEKTAREFTRFIDNSTWEISQTIAEHPLLNSAQGEDMSKNARLQQLTAQSVYGLAQENPNQLVVLISNQQNLRNDIDNLNINNLSSLPLAQFIQWLRTKQPPINISEKQEIMIAVAIATNEVKTKKYSSNIKTKSPNSTSSFSQQNNLNKTQAKVQKKSTFVATLISSIMAIVGFSFVGLILWYFLQPESFNKFLQKTGLPSLPSKSIKK